MIDEYEFGRIKIDGKEYTSDVRIFKDGSVKDWWRIQGHSIAVKDIEELVKDKPKVIVFGTGAGGVMEIPEKIRKYIIQQGIELFFDTTDNAVNKYNELKKKGAEVVAGFHLTC